PADPGTYYYRVRAFNVAGASDYTNMLQADVSAPDAPPGGGALAPRKIGRVAVPDDAALVLNTAGLGAKVGDNADPGDNPPALSRMLSETGSVAQVPAFGSTASSAVDRGSARLGESILVPSVEVRTLHNTRLTSTSQLASVDVLDELFALGMTAMS